jgi:hypothetical protein
MDKIKKKIKKRVIFSHDYNKMQVMIRDSWFIKKVAWLKNRFAEIGCPLPLKGFKRYKQYLTWNDRYWKRHSEMQQLDEYLNGRLKITGSKEQISAKEFDDLQDFDQKFLPPVYGEMYSEILHYYGLPIDNDYFRDFLESYIFFGKTDCTLPPFSVCAIRNKKTNKPGLFIQLYSHTRKEDILNYWNFIAKEQKNFFNSASESIGKNKAWEEIDRDIEIYNLYKKLKLERGETVKRANALCDMLDMKLFVIIHKKYPKINITAIRRIISQAKKRLGER